MIEHDLMQLMDELDLIIHNYHTHQGLDEKRLHNLKARCLGLLERVSEPDLLPAGFVRDATLVTLGDLLRKYDLEPDDISTYAIGLATEENDQVVIAVSGPKGMTDAIRKAIADANPQHTEH